MIEQRTKLFGAQGWRTTGSSVYNSLTNQKFVKGIAFFVLFVSTILPSPAYSAQTKPSIIILNWDEERKPFKVNGNYLVYSKVRMEKWATKNVITSSGKRTKQPHGRWKKKRYINEYVPMEITSTINYTLGDGKTIQLLHARKATRPNGGEDFIENVHGVYLVYHPIKKKEYAQKPLVTWTAWRGLLRYHTQDPTLIQHNLIHRVRKQTKQYVEIHHPNGHPVRISKKYSRNYTLEEMPWDGNNDYFYNHLPESWKTVFYKAGAYLHKHALGFVLLIAILAIFAFLLSRFNKKVNDCSAGNDAIVTTCVISCFVMFFFGSGIGADYINFYETVATQAAFTDSFKRNGLFILPLFPEWAEPIGGFFFTIQFYIFLTALITFSISLAGSLLLVRQYVDYMTSDHPAKDEVRKHIYQEDYKLDAEKLADDLETELGLNDPWWKIRNRTKKARELEDLYDTSASLGEAAIRHERKRNR